MNSEALQQSVSTGMVSASRAKSLSLTDSGRALAGSIEGELVRLRKEVLQGISIEDLEATLRVVRAFEEAGQRSGVSWPS